MSELNYKTEREALVKAGLKLVELGLVSRTWGNISLRVNKDEMLVTPSGKYYEDTRPEDMVLINIRTNEYDKNCGKPSSEFRLHSGIYADRPEFSAIIHTHQMNASTCAAARREVPPVLDDMAQIVGPSVRVADYALSSTNKLVRNTVKALRGRNAALMANHGAVCAGRDLNEAFAVCEVLEKACKAFIEAEFLGGAKSINKFSAWAMHQAYLKKYSKLAGKK
ncbi:class II aldolase/adducin family protein [Maribellus sp. CM-23]|uniref:class II aldolase/adducin family protein n=1 Tax=Maribellus sp. CM-23 TaxID=2781026 RepID=UPI001F311E68|nr:class II aldolase/adducin family protein [Maribellus sp. CM-23]MCE4564512.1 class II aldolase/adducin family protein [Maribellus sp. CM-23]